MNIIWLCFFVVDAPSRAPRCAAARTSPPTLQVLHTHRYARAMMSRSALRARATTGSCASVSAASANAHRVRRTHTIQRRTQTVHAADEIDLDALLPPDIDGDLESLQREAGANFGDDGFVVDFGSFDDEMRAIKETAAVIDRSDWGLVRVQGRGAEAAVKTISSVDAIASTSPGTGFEIEITFTGEKAQVYAQNEAFLLLVPPNSCDAVVESLEAAPEVVVAELNDRCALLTVVGPMSVDILRNSGLMEVVELDVGSHRVFGFDGRPVVAAHTSEYAVLGVNLIVDEGVAGQVWATISRTTVAPCGSRASDAVLVELGRVKSV